MIKKIDITNMGYVEGFYGKLHTWSNRKKLVRKLSKNNMKIYFYAPKEDVKNRLEWRRPYNKAWSNSFKNFCKFCKKNNVNVVAGLAPGLDFDYFSLFEKCSIQDSDLFLIIKKLKFFLENGATEVAILLDDIPDFFLNLKIENKSEGELHANLVNKISKILKTNIYLVPRIYASELIHEAPKYLEDLLNNLNKYTKIIFCGSDVVSEKIELSQFDYFTKNGFNEVMIWDNYYANDYCPRRIFVGPWYGRENIESFLINPTGMIETDLLILDIIYYSLKSKNPYLSWEKALELNKIPKQFYSISTYFNSPHFNSNKIKFNFEINSDVLNDLEFLLWKWKSKISIEWYPFLITLKQDILIYLENLPVERVVKTQSLPLAKKLLKK